LILTLTLSTCQSFYNIDDSSLYSINFNPLDKPEKISDDEALLNNPPDLLQTVTMTTSHNEKYVCQLPMEESREESKNEEYTGPSVLQLLERLFVQSNCAYRLEHYWTYELCHGKNLRQYHEEREGKGIKTTEYFLGYYSTEMHTENKKDFAENKQKHRKPLRKKIESLNMPYYEIIMKDGTLCDLNGQTRTTRVHYVCYPSGKNEIYSLKESSTCEYEVVVLTSVLCNHPDYKPEESKEKVINCKPANEKSATKPLNMIAMEAESLKLRNEKMYQAELFQGDSGPGSVRIEIKPVVAEGTTVPNPAATPNSEEDPNKFENWPEQTQRQPMKPLMDPEVVQEFLLGQHCLYGGSGWWKYEFCYGQKVDQYHEEKGEKQSTKKTVLNLGRFNLDKHREWIDQNPNKKPKSLETRKHVSHFYSGGDICDITGKPRHVEVKLKCKKSESASAVSIYLLEPKTCEYVLGVESPLVCDILASADEYGLMKMSSKADFAPSPSANSAERTTISTKEEREFVKFTLEDAVINGVPVNEVPNVVQKEEEKFVKSKVDQNSEKMTDKTTEDLIFSEDGRSYTEEEFNTVKEAMMDVYKRIKNNDIDFLLDDYEDPEMEGPDPEDDLATDYDEEEDEDE